MTKRKIWNMQYDLLNIEVFALLERKVQIASHTQWLLSFSPGGETGAMNADGEIGLFPHQYVRDVRRTSWSCLEVCSQMY